MMPSTWSVLLTLLHYLDSYTLAILASEPPKANVTQTQDKIVIFFSPLVFIWGEKTVCNLKQKNRFETAIDVIVERSLFSC